MSPEHDLARAEPGGHHEVKIPATVESANPPIPPTAPRRAGRARMASRPTCSPLISQPSVISPVTASSVRRSGSATGPGLAPAQDPLGHPEQPPEELREPAAAARRRAQERQQRPPERVGGHQPGQGDQPDRAPGHHAEALAGDEGPGQPGGGRAQWPGHGRVGDGGPTPPGR